ncbi:GNAT family N-acetyltransferase [Streptomyces chryseus]|uniref:GNAT family N-acetyltransferase n=1 Tax=Streptomyces chryseus TaxID=68186 RepID=UPI0027E58417|nr:GNAT family N-acetyltransferase [Streptomyces chryseus]
MDLPRRDQSGGEAWSAGVGLEGDQPSRACPDAYLPLLTLWPDETIMTSAEAVKRWTALSCWASICAMNNELPPMAKRVRFVELNAKALRALADGDLAGGSAEAGVALDEHFVCDRARWIFGYRADQVAGDPSAAPWVTRVAVSDPDGFIVGDAGFHGPPDEDGLVEVGYTVVPEYRRQGYARAMLAALLTRAAAEPGVRTVRATVGSDNNASLSTIAGFGFTRVGERGNERDGIALVFEVSADAIQAE